MADLLSGFDQEDAANDDDSSVDDETNEEALDEENQHVKEVMAANRDESTKNGYWMSQCRLVVFLYLKSKQKGQKGEKYRRLLHIDLINAFDRVKHGGKTHKQILDATLLEMKRASKSFQPIKLPELEAEVFLEFLLSLSETSKNEYLKAYGGHRSALTFLFTQCEYSPSPEFLQKLKTGMTGLKNTSAKAHGTKGVKLGEGKDPLPFELYHAICHWLLQNESTESVFAHCFLTMTWNLMCHSKNTVKIQNAHISWIGDALAVQFAHSKTDQMGSTSGWKHHIYANLTMPEICAVLSYAMYRQTFPSVEGTKLFTGDKQYDRFCKILGRVLEEHRDEVLCMGINPKSIGVHSI